MAVVDLAAPAAGITQLSLLGGVQHHPFENQTMFAKGSNCGVLIATTAQGASDSNGSIYRVFTNLDPLLIPIEICVGNTANTGLTSVSIGLYVPGVGGAAISSGLFATTLDLHLATTSLHPKTAVDGMAAILPANYGKALWELAGDASAKTRAGYDLALTAVAAGSGGGTVTVMLSYIIPQVGP